MTTSLYRLRSGLTLQRVTIPATPHTRGVDRWWLTTARHALDARSHFGVESKLLRAPTMSDSIRAMTGEHFTQYVDSEIESILNRLPLTNSDDEKSFRIRYPLNEVELDLLEIALGSLSKMTYMKVLESAARLSGVGTQKGVVWTLPSLLQEVTDQDALLVSLLRLTSTTTRKPRPRELEIVLDHFHSTSKFPFDVEAPLLTSIPANIRSTKRRSEAELDSIAKLGALSLRDEPSIIPSTVTLDAATGRLVPQVTEAPVGAGVKPSAAHVAREEEQSPSGPNVKPAEPGKIFIVHGRSAEIKFRVATLIKNATKLEPVILHEMANGGDTLIQKFERLAADVEFAVILLTADDFGGPAGGDSKPRARQNVIFEMGYFYGKVGRKRVATILDHGVEEPSDVTGVVYIPTSDWIVQLCREFEKAGIDVDWSKTHQQF